MYCWWVTQNPFPALLYSSVLLPNPYRSICCICLLFLKSLQCPLYMLYQHYKFSNDFHLFSLLQLPLLHIAVCVFSPLLVIWLEGYWECERDKKNQCENKILKTCLSLICLLHIFGNEKWTQQGNWGYNVTWNSLPHDNKLPCKLICCKC